MLTCQKPTPWSERAILYLTKPRTDSRRHIRCLLFANRGEIACRIVTTAQSLGIGCIVIYAEEDRDSLHATAGQVAICFGHIIYCLQSLCLDRELLVRTALDVRADAVHPGYSYLGENADFLEPLWPLV